MAEIESGALESDSDLPKLLRTCIALGGRIGTADLRDWASRDLKGYGPDDALPEYRRIPAPLMLDGFTGGGHVTGQMVAAHLLPDEARDILEDPVAMPQAISEIVDLVATASRGDGTIRLAPSGTAYVLPLISMRLAAGQQVERVYWAIEVSKLRGIVDKVRTILVELVAEMRAATPPGRDTPTPEGAQQAVVVAIYGGNRSRVVVNQTTASEGATVATSGSKASVSSGGEPETPHRAVMYWVACVGTVVAAVATVLALWLT
jgi:hypothetical protein